MRGRIDYDYEHDHEQEHEWEWEWDAGKDRLPSAFGALTLRECGAMNEE